MSKPELAVVVPSVSGLGDLSATLSGLAPERADTSLEVLVVNRLGSEVREAVASRYPWARVVDVPSDTPIPVMRAAGIEAATAPAVAIIEDHVLVPRGWSREMIRHLQSHPVVGGAVENGATTSVADWAAFLTEYSHLLPPLSPGPVPWLTGNNTAYDRLLIARHLDMLRAGAWESELHDAMRREGVPLWCAAEIVVRHQKHFGVAEYFGQRFLYSRAWAGRLARTIPVSRRLMRAAASILLPAVLLYRIVSRVLRKQRHRAELVRSLPLIALFVVAWAAGECIGFVAGAGNSLSRVR